MKTLILFALALTSSINTFAADPVAKTAPVKNPTAVIKTSMGDINVTLFKDKAPLAVDNFIGLSDGSKEWTDPKTGKKAKKGKSLYAGTIFHRVIPDFMIQGGDPMGTGMGGPGYQFQDETGPLDSFTKKGILAMANAGPNTNGSQFFITVAPYPSLNGHYTIFGEVTSGIEVAEKISKVSRNERDRPKKDVKIVSIKIKK